MNTRRRTSNFSNPAFPLVKFKTIKDPGPFSSAAILKSLGLDNTRSNQIFLAAYLKSKGYRKGRHLVDEQRQIFWFGPQAYVGGIVPAPEPGEDPPPPPAATPSGDPALAALEAAARAAVEHPEIEIRLACKAVLRTLDRIARRVSERKV